MNTQIFLERLVPLSIQIRLPIYIANEIRFEEQKSPIPISIPPAIHQPTRPFYNPCFFALYLNQSRIAFKLQEDIRASVFLHFFKKLIRDNQQHIRSRLIAQFFKDNALLYILLIFLAPNNTILFEYIRTTFPPDIAIQQELQTSPDFLFDLAKQACSTLKNDFDASIQIEDQKVEHFNSCMYFYAALHRLIHEKTEIDIQYVFRDIGRTPSYFPLHFKMVIQLVSYFEHSATGILQALNRCHPLIPIRSYQTPRGETNEERSIPFKHWLYLIEFLYIPKSTQDLPPDHPVRKFHSHFYLFYDQYPQLLQQQIQYQKPLTGEFIPKVLNPLSIYEICLPTIAFQMKNWKEIWYKMKWRRCTETQCRLAHLKKLGQPVIQPRDWVQFLFFDIKKQYITR